MEPISSHAEHARKCLKVEYLGRMEYDFTKSRVTGPWDHMVSVSAKKVLKKFQACVPLNKNIKFKATFNTLITFCDPHTHQGLFNPNTGSPI